MLLNLAADPASQNTLKTADFLFAAAVHAAVILLITILAWWQSASKPEPLNRIEVMMISGAELARLQKPAPKPAVKPKKAAPKAKPVLKFDPRPAKKTPVKAVEDNYDPFAP
ncbi:MAG: hypothetical protein K9M17_06140, partial [Mariprofundaceae bacterium]|nr:hypothetical protein [Mariprofundaceae bacterium]